MEGANGSVEDLQKLDVILGVGAALQTVYAQKVSLLNIESSREVHLATRLIRDTPANVPATFKIWSLV